MIPDDLLSGMRVSLAVPSYGSLEPLCAKSVRVAMMSASNHGLKWAGDPSPDRLGWSAARNIVAETAYLDRASTTGIVWIDADSVVPPDGILRLLDVAKRNDYDFVSGVYHRRLPPYEPVIYRYEPELDRYLYAVFYPPNQLVPMAGCGFGFVYTSTRLLTRIHDSPHFTTKRGWFPDDRSSGGLGEDLSFCAAARREGVQLYVDTGIQVGHLGDPKVVTERDFFGQFDKD